MTSKVMNFWYDIRVKGQGQNNAVLCGTCGSYIKVFEAHVFRHFSMIVLQLLYLYRTTEGKNVITLASVYFELFSLFTKNNFILHLKLVRQLQILM